MECICFYSLHLFNSFNYWFQFKILYKEMWLSQNMELHIQLSKWVCLICLILNQLQYKNPVNNITITHQSFYL